MNAREIQAENLAMVLVEQSDESGLPILLNGIAYKPGVEYTAGSYSLLVGHYCKEMGNEVIEIDPCVAEANGVMTDIAGKGLTYEAVVLLSHPELYVDLTSKSIVVDPWREYKNPDHTVIHYGNTRQNTVYN